MCSWGRLAERLWKHPEGLWAGWAGSRQEGGEGRSDSGHNLKVGLVGLAGKLDGDEEREELMTGCGCVPETNGGLDRGLVPMDLTCLLHAQTEIGESSSVLPRLPPPGRPGRPGTLVPQTDGSARFDVCPFARCRQAEADGEAGGRRSRKCRAARSRWPLSRRIPRTYGVHTTALPGARGKRRGPAKSRGLGGVTRPLGVLIYGK